MLPGNGGKAPPPPGAEREAVWLVHQPVELGGVLAGDLVDRVGRQTGELLLDVASALRPDAVGVRIVRAPHHRLDADLVEQFGTDRVELERAAALPVPVFAR